MFTTKPIKEMYNPFLDDDAGFVNFRVAEPVDMDRSSTRRQKIRLQMAKKPKR